ncbi:MAG TPA: PspA/IM30 family protein [Acidimicrobiales bacterium]|nr:PspA/IM30 family protein [Acidimicrobiales bacterium]
MFRRWINYIKSWFGMKSKEMMDPKVEIESAINEARSRDQTLRNEAAKVIAHRTRVAGEMEDAAADVAEAKELARQALLRSDAAAQSGNAAEADKWNTAAQGIAMKLQSGQKSLASYEQQLTVADQQAELAKTAVHDNAMRLEEIAAKRMEMLGQLEAAKMQESVNSAMASINANVGGDAPSLKEIEDKIEDRMASAMAKTELTAATPDGAIAELQREVNMSGATAALDDLRSELGLGPAPALPAGDTVSGPGTVDTTTSAEPAPAVSTPQPSPPAPAPPGPPPAPGGSGSGSGSGTGSGNGAANPTDSTQFT